MQKELKSFMKNNFKKSVKIILVTIDKNVILHQVKRNKIKMVVEDSKYSFSMNMNDDEIMDYTKIGRTVKQTLQKAQTESRVIVGLSAAIKVLNKTPDGSLFCLMAVPKEDDSATHMHEVLLEAFCYEHDIYVIKVDCPIKLSRILGNKQVETCCLVQKTWTGDEECLNNSENLLVDYCEAHWDLPKHPVVELPVV